MPKTSRSCLDLLLEDEGMVDDLTVARAGIDCYNHENASFELHADNDDGEKEILDVNFAKMLKEKVLEDAMNEIYGCFENIEDKDEASLEFVEIYETDVKESFEDFSSDLATEIISTHLFKSTQNKNLEISKLILQTEKLKEWLNTSIKQKYLFRETMEDDDEEVSYGNVNDNNLTRIGDPYKTVISTDILLVEGKSDRHGLPIGKCLVSLKNADHLFGCWRNGKREGWGNVTGVGMEERGMKLVQGYYKDGVLQGYGHAVLTNGLEFDCFFVDGFVHGPVASRLLLTTEQLNRDIFEAEDKVTGDFLGVYQAGVRTGYIWQGMLGGGWLHGKVDGHGQLTGHDIMFIYPDLVTCLYGSFVNGVMLEARETKILEVDFSHLIPEVRVSLPNKNASIFSFSLANDTQLTVERLLPDPYEQTWVFVKRSSVIEGGEGLFAKKYIPEGTFVSFYHGLLFPAWHSSPNLTSDYMIYLDWNLAPNSHSMDLPSDCWSTANYTASLGHKTNHSFRPNCMFCRFHHPRFGLHCLALKTMKDVKKGDELFTHYRYSTSYAPQWFMDLVEN